MHEYGMCDGIVAAVLERAAGRTVRRVRLRIGVQHRVVEDVLHHAFSHCAEGTMAENACVELVTVPMRGTCQNCTHTFDAHDILDLCPACGSNRVSLQGGDELILESLELEMADA